MKAIVAMIAIFGAPAVAVGPSGQVSEPALLLLAGSSLLAVASLLRRRTH
jgi:hypothetical protein